MNIASPIFAILCLTWTVLANPEASFKFFEYCRYFNYPVQDHVIPTDDHYNLQFYRIQAKNTNIAANKRVVYFQHGLVDSSDTWIVNNQSLAPAFYFANQGFDVWVGNSRGNRYSNKKLSPSVLNFWDFTFNDMAKFDLPAAFRYISRATQKKIHYIGHSQGTLIMFIALAEKVKDVQENLLSFNAYGPVAYIKHQRSKLMSAATKVPLLTVLSKSNINWLFMENKAGMVGMGRLCKIDRSSCLLGLKAISDQNNTVNNVQRLPIFLSHFPSGSSTKNFMHFQQYVKYQVFNNFDYGAKKNQIIYGQPTPPLYDLSKITIPVHLYVGKYDKLADVEDSTRLFNQLKNSVNKTMKIYEFGHATFVIGKSLQHVYDALSVINGVESPTQDIAA